MKKGFTLIELLGIIVILSLIAAISYPIVMNNINAAKQSAEESQINFIITAAKYWANDNSGLLSDTVGATYTLDLITLKDAGLLENSQYKDLQNGNFLSSKPSDQNKIKGFYYDRETMDKPEEFEFKFDVDKILPNLTEFVKNMLK